MELSSDNIFTVTQFNTLIKDVCKELGVFKIKGEITEFKITKNNGLAMTLSDGKANLKVGGYAPNVKGIDIVEAGMEVVVSGIADIYVPYGSFSLSAFSVEPVGEGALAIAYQKLKKKLESEGLFAEEHKQELPKFITKVALLTGKDSAAYSDFIKILKENNVSVNVTFYPVLVQGPKSVKSITSALKDAEKTDVDVIVLTRGGGSLEDLKSFNDEELVKLVFTYRIPIIVGVGHEKDESVCDFVADIRASTPSQAAYYIFEQNSNFFDDICERGDVIYDYLAEEIQKMRIELEKRVASLENTVRMFIDSIKNKLTNLERILKSFDIKSILKRGFALIQKDKENIKSIKSLSKNDRIKTTLFDGSFKSVVDSINK